MIAPEGDALLPQKSKHHENHKEPEGSLGGNQVKPVEGRGNRMKANPSLDAFVLHDGGSGDVAGEAKECRKNMAPSDPDEIRGVGTRKEASKKASGCRAMAGPYEKGGQISGEGEIDQNGHGNDVGIHGKASFLKG